MTHVYFHCSNAEGLYLDKRGAEVEDLVEAHQRAVQVVRDYVSSQGPFDWRAWILHVSDENGEELFLMPFSSCSGNRTEMTVRTSVMSSLLRQSQLRRDVYARCREAMNLWRRYLRRLFDPYRPEFHYMRGPGPKWREKHRKVPAAGGNARKMPNE